MKIIWTQTAENNIEAITDYILSNFSKREVNKFLDEVEKTIANVVKYPHIGNIYKKTIFRHILISKHTYLFYRIENDHVLLITFFNNNQNPYKLNGILFS
jgi:plasmid stabilization system protein ParE